MLGACTQEYHLTHTTVSQEYHTTRTTMSLNAHSLSAQSPPLVQPRRASFLSSSPTHTPFTSLCSSLFVSLCLSLSLSPSLSLSVYVCLIARHAPTHMTAHSHPLPRLYSHTDIGLALQLTGQSYIQTYCAPSPPPALPSPCPRPPTHWTHI